MKENSPVSDYEIIKQLVTNILPAGLRGELSSLLVELLESEESESLELEPELPEDDLDDRLPFTLARAAASLLLLRRRSSLEGAGGFAAPLTLIIPI